MIEEAQILDRVDALGTLPTSVARIVGLLSRPDVSLKEIEQAVTPDVSLTANLLRYANAPQVRAVRDITSVKDALARLGMSGTLQVAMTASFARAIPPRLSGYDVAASDFWSHSIAVAVLSDRLAKGAGIQWPGLAFTAGLLHDVGKLVLGAYLHRSLANVRFAPGRPHVDCEEEALGTTHAHLAERVAEKWHLPREVAAAGRWHHRPEEAPSASLRFLAAAVHVADALAHDGGFGCGGTPEVSAAALERLGLDDGKRAAVLDAVRPDIERMLLALRTAGGGSG